MKIGFCFAGQGSQYPSMGKDLYESDEDVRALYDSFPEIRDLCFTENELLNQTAYAQKAILLTSYAIAIVLRKKGIEPDYVNGLSLGEYSALTFSGVWSIEDAIQIVTERGQIMQNALPLGTTKMAAVIGMDRAAILSCLENIPGVCEIANYNCPGQIVITGELASVDEASLKLLDAGAKRVIPLNVSGAFHCSLLKDASYQLRKVLDCYTPALPKYKVIFNSTAQEQTAPINDLLQKQIYSSVYFEDSIRYMLSQGVDTFIEIGPGRALTGFIKKIDRALTVYTLNDLESIHNCVLGLKNEH